MLQNHAILPVRCIDYKMRLQQIVRVVAILTLLVTAGCGRLTGRREPAVQHPERLRIVATFFPVADIVRQVGGPHVEVQTILPPEGELHAFAPTARQMKLLHRADAVFQLGLDAEPFLQTMLRGLGRRRPPVFTLSKGCWTLAADAHHHHHDDEPSEHEHEHSDEGVDPHVWLSLRNAMQMARNARHALSELDPAHAVDYQRNAERLVSELKQLYHELQVKQKAWKNRQFIATHGAYRYLAVESGMEQVAVFEPLPGVEPSARWLRDLMRTARREKVKVIFAAPPASSRLVEVVAADLGVPVYLLDPLERTSSYPGESYQQRMRRNIQTLDTAMQ